MHQSNNHGVDFKIFKIVFEILAQRAFKAYNNTLQTLQFRLKSNGTKLRQSLYNNA